MTSIKRDKLISIAFGLVAWFGCYLGGGIFFGMLKPNPILLAIACILPAALLAAASYNDRRKPKTGFSELCSEEVGAECLTCGYNLTGNISFVCPECGSRVTFER